MSSVLAAIVGVGLGFALFSGYKILFPRVNVDIANGRLHDKNKVMEYLLNCSTCFLTIRA